MASLRYRATNGTVAPPSSRSTAAATWWVRTPSSSAMRCWIEWTGVVDGDCVPVTGTSSRAPPRTSARGSPLSHGGPVHPEPGDGKTRSCRPVRRRPGGRRGPATGPPAAWLTATIGSTAGSRIREVDIRRTFRPNCPDCRSGYPESRSLEAVCAVARSRPQSSVRLHRGRGKALLNQAVSTGPTNEKETIELSSTVFRGVTGALVHRLATIFQPRTNREMKTMPSPARNSEVGGMTDDAHRPGGAQGDPARTAGFIDSSDPPPRRRSDVGVVSLIGTTTKYYNFLVYELAVGLILGSQFFSSSDPLGSILTFLRTFGAGLPGRPPGTVLFGRFGDRFGRKRQHVASPQCRCCDDVPHRGSAGRRPRRCRARATQPTNHMRPDSSDGESCRLCTDCDGHHCI